MSESVALITWEGGPDSIARTIHRGLSELGYRPIYFRCDEALPADVALVFTFAPWGRLQQVTWQLARRPTSVRPLWVHWMTEDPPDLRLPWGFTLTAARARAWLDRRFDEDSGLSTVSFLCRANRRFAKFRYVGEYDYAMRLGHLRVLADISKVYADHYNQHGIPCTYVPLGMQDDWHGTPAPVRDIDVLWLGKRRTRRRSRLLDRIRGELAAEGVAMHVVDGVENEFVHGPRRNNLVGRSAIMLNLLPTWYDNALIYRLPLATASGCMLVSEPTLPHCPSYVSGTHFVQAPVSRITGSILYYLEHADARRQIVDAAHQLISRDFAIDRALRRILATAGVASLR